MDDLEFRKRAFANPHEQSPEFLAAARTSPERRQLLLQLQGLDARVKKAAHSIPVPAQLAAKLKALDEQPRNAPSKRARTERLFAVAASLLLAFGLALAPSLFTTRPNAADMQFHDEVIGHVYKEVARYDMNREDMSFEHINNVLEKETGGHFRSDERIKQLHIKFANGCNIARNGRGAHIVLNGSKGSISVMVVHSSPVSTTFDVTDTRFAGRIIPFGEGNLIIVGEKDEPLAAYESLIAEAFEWSI